MATGTVRSTVSSGLFGTVFQATGMAYDADTGTSIFNVTNVPSGTVMMGPSGEYLSLSFVNYGPTTMTPLVQFLQAL